MSRIVDRLARTLLRVAAARQPLPRRAETHREWLAELHVLAVRGRAVPMLAYASSLALSRPAPDPLLDRSAMTRTALRTTAFLLLMPLAGIAAMLLGAVGMNLIVHRQGGPDLMFLQEPIMSALVAAFGVGLALLARRAGGRSALTGPLALAVGAAVPCAMVSLLLIGSLGGAGKVLRVVPELILWTAGMVLVLWTAARTAAQGRVRRAWVLGLLGALVVADVAVALTVFAHTGPATVVVENGLTYVDGVDRAWAPLWLPLLYTGTVLGLPGGPTEWEIAQIGDTVEFTAYMYLAFVPYLLAYAVAAARRAPVATAEQDTQAAQPTAA